MSQLGEYEIVIVHQLIDMLSEAPRLGADKDEPEGARYIQLSDTLTGKIIVQLNQVARTLDALIGKPL